MKIFRLAAALSFAVFAATAHAAASVESVERLMQVMRLQAQLTTVLTQTLPAMQNAMKQSLAREFPSDEAERTFDAVQPRINALLADELSWDKLRPEFVALYADTFSQEEVDGLIAFYQGPLGSAMLDKMPMLMQRSMLMTQKRIGPIMQKSMQIAKEEAARESAAASAPAAPAKP